MWPAIGALVLTETVDEPESSSCKINVLVSDNDAVDFVIGFFHIDPLTILFSAYLELIFFGYYGRLNPIFDTILLGHSIDNGLDTLLRERI